MVCPGLMRDHFIFFWLFVGFSFLGVQCDGYAFVRRILVTLCVSFCEEVSVVECIGLHLAIVYFFIELICTSISDRSCYRSLTLTSPYS